MVFDSDDLYWGSCADGLHEWAEVVERDGWVRSEEGGRLVRGKVGEVLEWEEQRCVRCSGWRCCCGQKCCSAYTEEEGKEVCAPWR